MKLVVTILCTLTASLCFSKDADQLCEPATFEVGDITLGQFLRVHAEGLEQLEKSGDQKDSNLLTEQLAIYLKEMHLSINDLKEADLSNANLRDLDIRFLNLKEDYLKHADFAHANLTGVNLKEANLENANFTKAILAGADLKEANLENADLTDANLQGANLKEANVEKTTFQNADLTDADIHEAEGLTLSQLLACKSLHNAKLPEDFLITIRNEAAQLLESGR